MYKQMEYFVKIVELHSFTKAADEFFISQSAISQQIRILEDELGVELLKREKRSFKLTIAGEYFYQKSMLMLSELAQIKKRVKEIAEEDNVLKLGYLRNYNSKELQNTIQEFSKLYPEVNFEIVRGNHEELYDLIKNDILHLIISDQRRTFNEAYINYHLLYMDCYIALSKNNSLANRSMVDVNELSHLNCIVLAQDQQQAIEQEYFENIIGLKCPYKFVYDIVDAKLIISIDQGFMVVDKTFECGDNITIIPLKRNNQSILRNYCAFWKKDKTTYYVEEFVETYRNYLRKSNNE